MVTTVWASIRICCSYCCSEEVAPVLSLQLLQGFSGGSCSCEAMARMLCVCQLTAAVGVLRRGVRLQRPRWGTRPP